MNNIYDYQASPVPPDEWFDTLVEEGGLPENGFRLERIFSFGHPTPRDVWYDQPWHEWVMVIRGEATLEYGDGHCETMGEGDYTLIPPGCRHRVDRVSDDCVWLALHYASQDRTHRVF